MDGDDCVQSVAAIGNLLICVTSRLIDPDQSYVTYLSNALYA